MLRNHYLYLQPASSSDLSSVLAFSHHSVPLHCKTLPLSRVFHIFELARSLLLLAGSGQDSDQRRGWERSEVAELPSGVLTTCNREFLFWGTASVISSSYRLALSWARDFQRVFQTAGGWSCEALRTAWFLWDYRFFVAVWSHSEPDIFLQLQGIVQQGS